MAGCFACIHKLQFWLGNTFYAKTLTGKILIFFTILIEVITLRKQNFLNWGEAYLAFTPIFSRYPCSLSIHLIASISLTLPKYLWVVARLACLKIILLIISRGVPDRDAYVAACLLRS